MNTDPAKRELATMGKLFASSNWECNLLPAKGRGPFAVFGELPRSLNYGTTRQAYGQRPRALQSEPFPNLAPHNRRGVG